MAYSISHPSKKLWHMVREVYYMLRKSVSKQKILMDLHLLLKHSKISGKALANLITFHYHHRHHHATTAFYNPREVQFSCSNTPSFSSFTTTKRKTRHDHHDSHNYDAEISAKAFEFLNLEISDTESMAASVYPSPLSVMESRFPTGEELGSHVDIEAEEFIRRFYNQLRLEPKITATPQHSFRHRGPLAATASDGHW